MTKYPMITVKPKNNGYWFEVVNRFGQVIMINWTKNYNDILKYAEFQDVKKQNFIILSE